MSHSKAVQTAPIIDMSISHRASVSKKGGTYLALGHHGSLCQIWSQLPPSKTCLGLWESASKMAPSCEKREGLGSPPFR